jgi:signal transduction histidine kinase
MIAMQDNNEKTSIPLLLRGFRELLTSSINLVELAHINEKPDGSPKTLRYLERVEHLQNRMTLLLDQIVFLGEIADELKIKPMPLRPLFKLALDRYTNEIAKRHITVTMPATMPFVMGDSYYLSHAIIRLMSNAIFYASSEAPSIVISAQAQGNWVRCSIADNGLGIPFERQEAIFHMFTRCDPSVHEGLGLGLYTVKTILTHMHGHVGFESVRGQGSTFWFDLPTVLP